MALISAFITTKNIVKEKIEPAPPKGTRFDWDAYYADIRNGIKIEDQMKKLKRCGYDTTKPEPKKNNLLDRKRYEYDKRVYGKTIASIRRKNGTYRHIVSPENY